MSVSETVRENKFLFIGIAILAVFFIISLFYWIYLFYFISPGLKADLIDNTNKINQIKKYPYYSYLNGHGLVDKNLQSPNTVAVMIDNFPGARPQIGINNASIVYEVLAEGGVTRFMAIFDQATLVEMVGPVRSARPYFFDWLAEYGDPIYMHSGGSPQALKILKNSNIFDTDEFAYGGYYWRDYNYTAPHNLFTSSQNWQKLHINFGQKRTSSTWQGWRFGKLTTTSTDNAKTVSIKYSVNNIVRWDYSSVNKNYNRFINNTVHSSEKEGKITTKNIVVQFVPTVTIDEIGRRKLTTTGSGEVRVLRDGKIVRGTWKKTTPSSRTRFYDRVGQEIELSAGKTWVEIVPSGTELVLGN